jgi:hypothetical protein
LEIDYLTLCKLYWHENIIFSRELGAIQVPKIKAVKVPYDHDLKSVWQLSFEADEVYPSFGYRCIPPNHTTVIHQGEN